MISKMLRIGPMLVIEWMTLVAGILIGVLYGRQCWSLALIECALTIYVAEVIIAYHLIEHSRKYNWEYMCRVAAYPTAKLYFSLIWNQLILLAIIILWIVSTVSDGRTLFGLPQASDCQFSLYPLCMQYSSQVSSEQPLDLAQLSILFIVFSWFNCFVLLLAQVKQFKYIFKLLQNRKRLARQYYAQRPLLAEQDVFECRRGQAQHQCTICLCEFIDGDIVQKMPCQHIFHSECLQKWLQKRNQCPFRCYNYDEYGIN